LRPGKPGHRACRECCRQKNRRRWEAEKAARRVA
jgi:hypothetical protein